MPVERAYDAHEARGHDTLDQTEEEALSVETSPVCHGCGQHAEQGPETDDDAEVAAHVETLEGEGRRVEVCEHAEVEHGCCPGETGCFGGWRGGFGVELDEV